MKFYAGHTSDTDRSTETSWKQLRALIIGGGGILGRHIAAQLVSRRVYVTVHGGRNKHAFRSTIAHLKNINAHCVQGVWSPIHNHQRFYQKIIKYLPVEIMIFLYGPYIQKPISSTTYQDWQSMANGNFVLPAACLSANMEYLQNTRYGRVIGFASDYRTDISGYRQIAAYAAAKWALSSSIQSATAQNANPYTKFYLIAPGYIDYTLHGSPSNGKPHQHSVDDVVRGVIALLDQKINVESGTTVKLDRILQIK